MKIPLQVHRGWISSCFEHTNEWLRCVQLAYMWGHKGKMLRQKHIGWKCILHTQDLYLNIIEIKSDTHCQGAKTCFFIDLCSQTRMHQGCPSIIIQIQSHTLTNIHIELEGELMLLAIALSDRVSEAYYIQVRWELHWLGQGM